LSNISAEVTFFCKFLLEMTVNCAKLSKLKSNKLIIYVTPVLAMHYSQRHTDGK